MASRDTEFAAFVDDRGPALWRTASLLELDPDAAEAALVSALASTARRWRSLSRDGDAELDVRGQLYRELTGTWRRTGSMLEVPLPEALADAARPRQALGALNHADRGLIVLTAYESMSPHEAASLLRLRVDDPQVALGSASARLRQTAGVDPDAPLLPLLNAAALREVPDGLTTRALAASRRSGRRAVLLAGAALLALVAVIAGANAMLREAPTESTPPAAVSLERWGIPGDLPTPRGLPSLADQPIGSASMAYVVQGVPVVVEADSGEVRTVLSGTPQPAWYDGNVDGVQTGLLRRAPAFTQALLSPDGEWLLLVQARSRQADPGAPGDLYLVKVASGEVIPVRDANPTAQPQGSASIADTVLSWSPGGGAFACVCDGRLAVYDLEPVAPRVVLASGPSYRVTDVAWGGSGLLARTTQGRWLSVSSGNVPIPPLGDADALAASTTTPSDLLVVSLAFIYALGSDAGPDGGTCVLWDSEFSDPVVVTPVPDRDGDLCTPVALQPGRSGVLLVLRPDRPRPQPLPLDVVTVDGDGASTVIATLPPGTGQASFAARLVG
jgi:hypothetical protein